MRKIVLLFAFVLGNLLGVEAQTKVSVLGDSYSTFIGHITPETNASWYGTEVCTRQHNDVVKVEQTWWSLIVEKLNAKLEKNNSYSGTTICHTGHKGRDVSDRSFIARMHFLGDPDIIFVFGGTNDAWLGVPMGEFQYADWTHKDLYNFRSGFSYLLHQLLTLYPNAVICNISNCDLNPTLTQSMNEVCKHYGVLNVELQQIDKIASHPSVKGMQMICDQVYDALKNRK